MQLPPASCHHIKKKTANTLSKPRLANKVLSSTMKDILATTPTATSRKNNRTRRMTNQTASCSSLLVDYSKSRADTTVSLTSLYRNSHASSSRSLALKRSGGARRPDTCVKPPQTSSSRSKIDELFFLPVTDIFVFPPLFRR